MKFAVIITAAGQGIRFGTQVPKQFLSLRGKPVLSYSVTSFAKFPEISKIYVVVPADYLEFTKDFLRHLALNKEYVVIEGGQQRQDSVNNAITFIEGEGEKFDRVLVHDGVRPLLSSKLIRELIEKSKDRRALIPVVEVKETVKILSSKNKISKTIDRTQLRLIQTPQAFDYEALRLAYRRAYQVGFIATDDAALIEKFTALKIDVIPGEATNIKITTEEDLVIAESFLTGHRRLKRFLERRYENRSRI